MLAGMSVPRTRIEGRAPFNWPRAAALAGCLLLAACSGPSFSVPVDNVVIPGGHSGGTICYVRGSQSSPVRFASATYSAAGTYVDDNPLTNKVVIEMYGRTEPPEPSCVGYTEGVDRRLSDPIELPEDDPTPIVVGGELYGDDLAAIIHSDQYWLGARISENYSLLGNEEIRLENGHVSVAIW
jgi:hypothetical protein